MPKTIWLEISLASQALSGSEALEVRNALEEQIEETGIGEVIGGGCAIDGSGCDMEISAVDLDTAEQELRRFLSHIDLLNSSDISRT